MRIIVIISLIALLCGVAVGQTALQKLVDTEYAFAAMAAEKNTRTAFLTFLADDGVVFGIPNIITVYPKMSRKLLRLGTRSGTIGV